MPPPIILIHRGDSFYLAHTIAQARSSNPNSRLILLGDRSNSFYLGVEHHSYEDYFNEAREFAKLFTYEFFPNYQYPWILFCHQKYFALRDFIRAQRIERFLLIDSDVLLYEPIEPYFTHYKNARMTVSGPPDVRLVHAAFAIINDISVLDDVCQTYRTMYKTPVSALQEQFGTALFYEMVGLHAVSSLSEARVQNTYGMDDDFVISHSTCEDPLFKTVDNTVMVHWHEAVPYLQEIKTTRTKRTPALHFHGKGKYVMQSHLRIKDGRLRLQHLTNRILSSVLKYPLRCVRNCGGGRLLPKI